MKVTNPIKVSRSNMMQIEGRMIIGSIVNNMQIGPVHIVRIDSRPGFIDPALVSEKWYGDSYNYSCHTARFLYPYEGEEEQQAYYDDLEHYRESLSFWEIKEMDARVGLFRFMDDFGNEVIIEGDIPFGDSEDADTFPIEEEDLPF